MTGGTSVGICHGIAFPTPATGIAVGNTINPVNPYILKTVNSGASWSQVSTSLPAGSLNAVAFSDPATGFAVGSSSSGAAVIISTSDSGNHWSSMSLPNINCFLSAVHFPTHNAGYAVGNGGVILKYQGTTGVQKLPCHINTCSIYPNPATDKLVIENAADGASISIFNVVGRLVYKGTISSSRELINIQSFAPGSYFARIENNNGVEEKKFVVKH